MQRIAGGSKVVQPRCDADLAALARPVADHAASLLALGRARLLSLTISTRPPAHRVTMGWNGSPASVPISLLIDMRRLPARRSLALLEAAGDRLAAQLAFRWPLQAVPPAIGFATDGIGVAFSPDHPSPLQPDWLAIHQIGLSTPMTLLAFCGGSDWAVLPAVMPDQRTH